MVQWDDFDHYEYFLISANYPWDFTLHDRSIVFYMSNEDHLIPNILSKAHTVLTPYCPLTSVPDNCYPIPLGYNGSLKDLDIKPILRRTNDVFYSGNIHKRRIPFYFGIQQYTLSSLFNRLSGKNTKINNHLFFTRSFGGGLEPNEYSELLMDSKIALVPEGYKSDVSFRFFEAAKYGNVIITKKLYNYWFFNDFPGIQVNNWFNLYTKIKSLLADPVQLEEIHRNTLAYYDKYLNEEKVASFIIHKIETT